MQLRIRRKFEKTFPNEREGKAVVLFDLEEEGNKKINRHVGLVALMQKAEAALEASKKLLEALGIQGEVFPDIQGDKEPGKERREFEVNQINIIAR